MLKLLCLSKQADKQAAKQATRKYNDELAQNTRIIKETNYLLNIFPELVWHQISVNITNHNDFLNFINSSRLFRIVSLQSRTLHLFKPVLEILTRTLSLSSSHAQSLILNCRLVCRTWNKSILALSEETWNLDWNIKVTSTSKPVNKFDVGIVIKKCYTLSSIDNFNTFLFTFGSCYHNNINPFPGRGVTIVISSTQFTDLFAPRFYRKLTRFLETFGRFILHCEFRLHLGTTGTDDAYCKLVEFFGSLPNLKTLIICNLNPGLSTPTLRKMSLNLRHLHTLKFKYVSSTVCNAIIHDNWQIRELHIVKLSFDIYNDICFNGGFENLEQLVLRGCNWKEIQKLSTHNLLSEWPVKRFHLELDTNAFQWADIFEVLSETFNETLEELILFLPAITRETYKQQIFEQSQQTRLTLSKLKKLNIEMKNSCSFDFLLGVKSTLELLHIHQEKCKTTQSIKESLEIDQQQIVKIRGYQHKLHESNIWKLFPKLKEFELD